VAVQAVIEAADVGALRVTTTHLAYYSAAQRLAQVEALRGLHAVAQGHRHPPERADDSRGPFHWWPRPGPGIVTGDFNCEPGSPGHSRMLAPFDADTPAFHDAWLATHSGQPHANTVGLYDTEQWPRPFACDFVFVSADLVPRIVAFEVDQASSASDHQAVVLTLA
jgi:endonuclease/exonuclease/phosphatase family metal-dependent hydrolase